MTNPTKAKVGFGGALLRILLLTVFSILFAVYAGISAKLIWEGFSWGWNLFGL